MDHLKVFNYEVMSLICNHIRSHNYHNTYINDYSKIDELLEIRSKLLSKLDHNHCACNCHQTTTGYNDIIDKCYDQSNLSVKIYDREIGDHTNDETNEERRESESESESEMYHMCTTNTNTNTMPFSERKPKSAIDMFSKCGKTRNTANSKTVLQFINCEAIEVNDKYGKVSDVEVDTQREIEVSFSRDTQVDTNLINDSRTSLDIDIDTDMRAFYMRSVKSQLIGGPNQHKYKLQYNYDRTIDVYSQNANECELESTDYEMDSFCVPNDCIIYDNTQTQTDSTHTQTVSTNRNRFLSTHRKRRFKRIAFKP